MIFKFITDKGRMKRTLGQTFDSKYARLVALKLSEGEQLFGVLLEEGHKLFDHSAKPMIPVTRFGGEAEDSSILTAIRDADDQAIWDGEDLEEQSGELQRIPQFIRISTEKGLIFHVPEGECEVREKMVQPETFAVIPAKDRIQSIHYEFDYEIGTFSLEVDEKGEIRPVKGRRKALGMYVDGDSYTDIVLVTSDGMGHRLPGYLFENIEGPVRLSNLFEYNERKTRIAGAFTGQPNVLLPEEILMGTSAGLIKRTELKEFLNAGFDIPVVKFRSDADQLIFARILDDLEENVILVTAKGMAIKFPAKSASLTGRIAAGVQGVSLKDDDSLVWGNLEYGFKTLQVETNRGGKDQIAISAIRRQNRAGKGSSIMKMVLDEEVDQVTPK